jgi:hypothetical protein
MAGLTFTLQTSAIATSIKGMYMQPQAHNDCTRDCNIERFYCKTTNYFYILVIFSNCNFYCHVVPTSTVEPYL